MEEAAADTPAMDVEEKDDEGEKDEEEPAALSNEQPEHESLASTGYVHNNYSTVIEISTSLNARTQQSHSYNPIF